MTADKIFRNNLHSLLDKPRDGKLLGTGYKDGADYSEKPLLAVISVDGQRFGGRKKSPKLRERFHQTVIKGGMIR